MAPVVRPAARATSCTRAASYPDSANTSIAAATSRSRVVPAASAGRAVTTRDDNGDYQGRRPWPRGPTELLHQLHERARPDHARLVDAAGHHAGLQDPHARRLGLAAGDRCRVPRAGLERHAAARTVAVAIDGLEEDGLEALDRQGLVPVRVGREDRHVEEAR